MAILQGGSLLLVLFSVIGLAVWEYQVTLRQTEKLLDGFEALRSENYDHRVDLEMGEEWEQIGAEFNDLSSALAEREQAIREREERLSVLNRVLRHNLRNEMTLILNYAGLIADAGESTQVRDAGEKIEERGEHLLGLGDLARDAVEAMDRADELVEMDLVDRVDQILRAVGSDYPETTVTIETPERAPVAVVPTFERAISNVVENAFVHNDADDPSVSVRITTDGETATLTVRDNGPGIPDQEIAALEGPEEPLEHGSGLGLWVTNWLVRKSDGELAFAANDPRGTVVRLTVPLTAE